MSEAAVKPGWIRRLWGYMLRHRRDVVLSVGAAVLGSVCQTAVPLVAREDRDRRERRRHARQHPPVNPEQLGGA